MDIQLIRELHRVTVADGEDAAQKGTQMLEIYALEIQMHNEMKNYKKLKVYWTMIPRDALSHALVGNLLRRQRGSFSDPASQDIGCDQRVWWQNVDGRTLVACAQTRHHAHLKCTGNWNRANEDFFESFKNYDEAGSPQRIQVLKYLVLANMLAGSEVNPFDSQETKP